MATGFWGLAVEFLPNGGAASILAHVVVKNRDIFSPFTPRCAGLGFSRGGLLVRELPLQFVQWCEHVN